MRLRSVSDEDDGRADHTLAGPGAGQSLTGDLLVDMGAMGRGDLDRVTRRQADTGERFGEAALALGLVDEPTLARAVERQQNFHVLAPDDDRVHPTVVAAFYPTDPIAQAARRLRSTISATSRADGEPLHLLMLLGVDTRAEAALMAANLAVAFAQTGYRTLLVDANLDAPVQHDLFRVSNRSGLSVLLAKSDAADAAQPTAVSRLSVLPAGPMVRNFAELLDRARLYARLREIADRYDIVLVDASHEDPAIAVAAADGADGSIIVVRRDDSSMQRLRTLIDELEKRGTPVMGTVLTT